MLRILMASAALIMLVAIFLYVIKLYIRRFVRNGRVISVFVPPPFGRCVIYGFRFQVIGDLQISVRLEGESKENDETLYTARPLEGGVSQDLGTPITLTPKDSLVIRRYFGTGTIVGFVPIYSTEPVVTDPAHDEFVEDSVNS